MGQIINNQIPPPPGGGQIINNQIPPPPGGGQIINNANAAGWAQFGSQQIVYDEIPTYTESYDQQGNESTRVLVTNWSNYANFPAAMMGDVTVAAGATGFFNRSLPENHPLRTWQYVEDLRLRDGKAAYIRGDFGLIAYRDVINNLDGLAVCEVTYRAPRYKILGNTGIQLASNADNAKNAEPSYELGRWVARDTRPATEALGLPGNAFKWLSDNRRAPFGITKMRPMMEVRYWWHWVPQSTVDYLQYVSLPQTVGTTNKFMFDGLEEGTVLCTTPNISKLQFTPTGNPVRDVEFIMLARLDVTWNEFYRVDKGGFDTLVSRFDVGDPPYAETSFGKLFQAA